MPNKKEEGAAFYIKLIVVLTVICIVVAAMLAAVNLITKDVIANNEAKSRETTAFSIFEGADKLDMYSGENADSEIYLVLKGNEIVGYCVNIEASGFGGAINMMVGVDASNAVKGVQIISLSETPGVGSKTKDASFLSQFIGKSGNLTVAKAGNGADIDAISGATISSKAVTKGVNDALACKVNLSAIATEKGYTLVKEG